MTLRHMRIFIQVYGTQNITKAADILHMTQPAVTRAIKEIEQYYGVTLFDRINRRLSVTESGKQFYGQALHIIDAFDTMEKSMRNWDHLGILRIGASVTIGNFLLPNLVGQFQKDNPQVKIQSTISNGTLLQAALMDNGLDLALIEGNLDEPDLIGEIYTYDHLVLLLPPAHPLLAKGKIYFNDLMPYDFLLREKGSSSRIFLDTILSVHGMALHPLWESVSTQALVKAVHSGIGISILPEPLVHDNIASGFVATRSIEGESFQRPHYIAWHKNKFLTKTAKNFILLCKSFVNE